MAGGVASALLQASRRGTRLSGDTGLFEVDEFWLGQVVDELRPRALLLAQPLPRPARPLRRARHDRRPLGRRSARARPPTSSSTPTTRPSPTSAAPAAATLGTRACPSSASRTTRSRWTRCSTPPTPSTAAAAARRTATTPSTSGTSAATTATTAARTARSPTWPPPTSCSRASAAARFTLRTPAGERPIALPLPGLYNVYNALAAAALSLALGASLDDVAAGLHAVSPAFGRAETVRLGGRDLSILLVKNPAGANEVLRTLALEPGEHDLLAILNDQVADGRDVSWVWDADFEVLAGARAARDLQRDARRGDGAAAEVRGRADGADRGRDRPRRGPRPGAPPRRRAACSRSRPTPRCSRCATCSSRAAPRGAASRERRPAAGRARARGHLARRRVRRLRRGPAAVARARDQPRRPGARRRRRDRPRVAPPRRPGPPRSSRSTARPTCSPRCAPARPACRSRPSRPTRATSTSASGGSA